MKTILILLTLFLSTNVFAQNIIINDITKVPLIGTGIITIHGSGGSLPGCNFNTYATNKSFPEDLQKAKSISYSVNALGRCENIEVLANATLPPVDQSAFQLSTNPPLNLSWKIVTSDKFNVYEVNTVHGTATMFESGLFKCAVGDKAVLQRLEMMGFFKDHQGTILSMRNTKTGNELEEPYSRCVDFRMIMNPSLYVAPIEPPPIQCSPDCTPL